jgi:hypothetical protein
MKILMFCLTVIVVTCALSFKDPTPPPDYCYRVAKINTTIGTGIGTIEVWKVSDNGTILYVVINTQNGNASITQVK